MLGSVVEVGDAEGVKVEVRVAGSVGALVGDDV